MVSFTRPSSPLFFSSKRGRLETASKSPWQFNFYTLHMRLHPEGVADYDHRATQGVDLLHSSSKQAAMKVVVGVVQSLPRSSHDKFYQTLFSA